MGDVIGDVRVARARRAALNHEQIRHLATTTTVTALSDHDHDIPQAAVDQLVDAVLPAVTRWLELRGVLLAADRLDNLISDTQRHLIDPAAHRAGHNPDLNEILMLHQQYIDGMREARTEIGSTASHVFDQAAATAADRSTAAAVVQHAPPGRAVNTTAAAAPTSPLPQGT